jgi:hypothetical protein
MSTTDPAGALVLLRDGELLRCSDRHDTWVTVVQGRVWITQANDLDDHFIDAGQSMRLAAGADALIGAEGAARLMVMQGPGQAEPPRDRTMGVDSRPAVPTRELAAH